MAATPVLTDVDTIRVKVGSGRRAHVFEPHAGANYKVMTLRDGGSVFDIAACGARGELWLADEAMDDCGSCHRGD